MAGHLGKDGGSAPVGGHDDISRRHLGPRNRRLRGCQPLLEAKPQPKVCQLAHFLTQEPSTGFGLVRVQWYVHHIEGDDSTREVSG